MKKLRKLTLAALLTAAGLVVFVIEAQLPPLTAIPGIKPGLSNVFTMLTLFWVGPSWALGTMFVRVSLGCLLTGQTMAFFVLVFSQIVQAYNIRSELSLFRIGPFSNRTLNLAALLSLGLSAIVLFTPARIAFGLELLTLPMYGIALALTLVPLVVMECSKAFGLIKHEK